MLIDYDKLTVEQTVAILFIRRALLVLLEAKESEELFQKVYVEVMEQLRSSAIQTIV